MKLYPRNFWEQNYPEDKMSNACPFCEEENEYIIHSTQYWNITHNKFPILGLREHIMAVPKEHFIYAKDMPNEFFADYKNIEQFVSDFYWEKPYFTFMRESLSGRSIEHLHYHFLPGKMYYKVLENMLKDQGFTNQLDSD